MIINADDFGISRSVNQAVTECFRRGWIDRTTILVNMPETETARELAAKNHFSQHVGLHLNLTEGRALTEICRESSLCDENGFFKGNFHVPIKSRFFLPGDVKRAIYAEAETQIVKYLEMGFTLKHLDSHNYVHTYFSVAAVVDPLIKKYDFRSVRISRNIPPGEMSPLFAVYKTAYNFYLRHLRTRMGRLNVTKYFGSCEDFEKLDNTEKKYEDTELMTHPIYKDGELYDDTLPHPHPFVEKEWREKHHISCEGEPQGRKIRMLVCFIQAHIGGAMTSLVNFLNALDCEKYDVDVLFYENSGGRHGIKEEIHILPPAKVHEKYSLRNVLSKALYPPYAAAKIRETYYKKIAHNRRKAIQIMARQGCRYSRRLDKEYDIAISYEFSWCMYYTVNYVKAKKKILWHHGDYEAAGMDFKEDESTFDKADALVFVSEECRNKFIKAHPQYQRQSWFLPNLLASEYVRNRGTGEEKLPFAKKEGMLVMLTVARINFSEKGLDRGVDIIERLQKEGLTENLRWVVVGKGSDYEEFCRMIEERNLQSLIYPVGARKNPIPYMKECDFLFLPSRHEGKPMVVTEAQIMGLVPLVSRYTSADEQIKNRVDGLICENNEEDLYQGVKEILLRPEILGEIRAYLKAHDYGNEKEIKAFDALADRMMSES